jgi:hypothetical protein
LHPIENLYESIDSRLTPEAVCALILDVNGHRLLPAQRRILARVADTRAAVYTSMSDDFTRPVPLEHKVRKLAELLGLNLSEDTVAHLAGDPWRLLGELRALAPFVGWHPGSDYRSRLNSEQRAALPRTMGGRRYNRIVRHMLRTQEAAKRMQHQIMLRQLVMVSRSGLAYGITVEEMHADVDAACFVAYWASQKNRRRQFTLAGRDNPFDTIAQILLERCTTRPDTDWWMIARAYPHPAVVARLSDERQGELMGHWFGFMSLGATMLKDLRAAWPEHAQRMDLRRMIVQPGMDSSTWNTVAAAYNAARTGWINSLGAAGALDLLNVACPGKAMRLMAADLAGWHQTTGGDVDPQTAVWSLLPMPWDVLNGAPCPAELVEFVCRRVGVDPHAAGWTSPRQHNGQVAEWKPTPELVHGVEIADPLWAGLLRRAGVFSGRPVKDVIDAPAAAAAGQN